MSWWELREFLFNLKPDADSAYYRARNPDDWAFSDVKTLMMADLTTAASDLRWLTAARMLGAEDMPERWAMRLYGPQESEPESDDSGSEDVETARATAASIRG